MKRIMAVYDVDPFYAARFAEFVNQKEQVPFTAVAFGSLGRLQAFTGQQPVELLLVGDDVGEEEIVQLKVKKVVRLSESGGAGTKEDPVIYKYQSSDAILREVMGCYRTEEAVPQADLGLQSAVVGVYSPVGRCGKSGFCFTMGQVLAQDRKVLYLNLEEYSGLGRLTGAHYKNGLSDLLYYFRQGTYNQIRLGSVLHTWGNLDYVPPVSYAEDLAETSGGELARLIARIADDGGYHVVLLDLGNLCRGMEPLLELCQVIYTPVREDCVAAAKIEEWHQYLEESGRSYLWDRVLFLNLPAPERVMQAENYLERLLWGEMGDYVRSLLKGRGEHGGDEIRQIRQDSDEI